MSRDQVEQLLKLNRKYNKNVLQLLYKRDYVIGQVPELQGRIHKVFGLHDSKDTFKGYPLKCMKKKVQAGAFGDQRGYTRMYENTNNNYME